MLGLLCVAFSVGLLAADFGFLPRATLGAAVNAHPSGLVGASVCLGGVAIAWIRRATGRRSLHGRDADARFDPRSLRHRFLCLGLAWATAFLAGALRLEGPLAAARQDAAAAARSSGLMGAREIRFLEARVGSRRSVGWGEEVELVGVKRVDQGEALPARLRLFIEGEAEGGESRSASSHEASAHPRPPASRAGALLWPGALVRLGARVQPIRSAANPGSPSRGRAAARRGLGAEARMVDPDWVVLIEEMTFFSSLRRWLAQMDAARRGHRDQVADMFRKHEVDGGLARALVLGDRSGLDPDSVDAMRRRGLAHLIAVSGLHVTVVALGFGWGVTRVWARLFRSSQEDGGHFGLSLLLAGLGAVGYGWMSGAGVSVRRAAMLFAFFAVFRASGRTVPPLSALSGVALALLLFDPSVLFEAGAQLSFASCAGLIVGGFWGGDPGVPPAQEALRRGERIRLGWVASARVSLAVSFATAPVLFAFGLAVSPGAPLWNVLAIPWTAFLVLPCSMLSVLVVDWAPTEFLRVLLAPGSVLEIAVQALDREAPRIVPWDWLPGWAVVLFAAGGLWLMRLNQSLWAAGLWLGIVCLGSGPWLMGTVEGWPPRLVFFDVGQGDAALIQGRTATLMVDTGGGRDDFRAGQNLVRGARALGVVSIDLLVITHGDLDHRAGAKRILRSIPVREVWMPSGAEKDASLIDLALYAERYGAQVRWLSSAPGLHRRGDLGIEVLWPPRDDSDPDRSRNDGSLVLRVTVGDLRALLTGDIGAEVERTLLLQPEKLGADLLKVAHHGSRGSSTEAWIRAVDPTWAVLSAPCVAGRGLPSPEILRRFEHEGVVLAWTGRSGAQIFGASASQGRKEERLQSWRSSQHCPED